MGSLSITSFDALKVEFQGDLVMPEHPDYEEAITRWCAGAKRRAKVVAFVKSEEDVARVLKYATAEKLPLAIRGGGHNIPGASSSEGGIVVDLSRYYSTVRIDPTEKLAYVGGGAKWVIVEKAAIEHGLATVGGTENDTGVGGLTLGGGWGYLSGEHGLTIDNLEQVKITIADGTTRIANASENSDLFWAVRGGGSNFGVVTEFVFRLHEQRRTVYAGIMIFPGPLAEAALQATEQWINSKPPPKAAILHGFTRLPNPERTPCVMNVCFYNGSEEEGRGVFKPLLDLKPIDQTREMPYEEVNTLTSKGNPPGQFHYSKAVVQAKYRAKVSLEAYKRLIDFTETSGLSGMMGFGLVNGDKINSVHKHTTAFVNRERQIDALVMIHWDEDLPGIKEKARIASGYIVDAVASNEEKPAEATEKVYGNFVGEENVTPDTTRKLFGENYPRLQQLKKKYDPGMLFSKWYPIAPAA